MTGSLSCAPRMESISAPPNAGVRPLAWQSLTFNPVGLYDLCRRLGFPSNPAIFSSFRQRFDTADVAWFTPGLASLPCNEIGEDDFYPDFLDLRSNTPRGNDGTDVRNALRRRVKELTFDSVRRYKY